MIIIMALLLAGCVFLGVKTDRETGQKLKQSEERLSKMEGRLSVLDSANQKVINEAQEASINLPKAAKSENKKAVKKEQTKTLKYTFYLDGEKVSVPKLLDVAEKVGINYRSLCVELKYYPLQRVVNQYICNPYGPKYFTWLEKEYKVSTFKEVADTVGISLSSLNASRLKGRTLQAAIDHATEKKIPF